MADRVIPGNPAVSNGSASDPVARPGSIAAWRAKTTTPDAPLLGPEFFTNRLAFPGEELWKYIGKHIAWSWDGSRIVGAADTPEELEQLLVNSGFDPSQVVHDYVDDPDVSHIG